jgi:hypothetical protein
MSRYLEEAADILRTAKKSLDVRHSRSRVDDGRFDEERRALARDFATLAAVDKGLLPAEITAAVIQAIAERSA